MRERSTPLTVMTFNLPGPDKLPSADDRVRAAAALISSAHPDVIGLQELVGRKSSGQPSDFATSVEAAVGKGWTLVTPTTDLNENYALIDDARLELVDQYPDKILPSKAGGRHCTRMVLRAHANGLVFAFGVTHLVTGPNVAKEQAKQGKTAMGAMNEVSKKHGKCPIVMVGDMNRSLDLPAMIASGLVNARKVAKDSTGQQFATFATYAGSKPSTNPDNIIDHVYVPKGWTVTGYTVLDDSRAGGRFHTPRPSDHLPVVVSATP